MFIQFGFACQIRRYIATFTTEHLDAFQIEVAKKTQKQPLKNVFADHRLGRVTLRKISQTICAFQPVVLAGTGSF